MGHEYNEMIDILSESINLTESMPMAREIEEFEPIFADEYSIYNPSLDPYQMISDELMNPAVLNLDINRRNFTREEQPQGRLYYRRSSRRSNSLPQRNIVFCSYARSRPNNFMPIRSVPPPMNLLNNSSQTQPNPNNIQIELSSDSGDEGEIPPRRHNLSNRDRRRREDNFRNKRQGNSSARQTNQIQPVTSTEGGTEQTQAVQHDESSSSRGANSQQPNAVEYLANTTVDHETNEVPCDCSQCLPEGSNPLQNKRKHFERSRMCKHKQVKRQCRPTPSSSQMHSIEPLPGPSGISSNLSTVTHQMVDSSDSDEEVPVTAKTNNQRMQSDVLTAPELQLDCFSDTSSDSSNDVIAIETPNASSTTTAINIYDRNSNISNEGVQSRPLYHRNRGYESTGGGPSNPPLRPLMSINTPGTQSDSYRCPYNQNFQYSQIHRNNYCANNNRYYPDARAPNAPDFGRNSVFNSSNSNFNNSDNSQNNAGGQSRSFGRWLNRGDNHYRRRFYNNAPRPSTYIPHQRLWHQQHLVQEMYRRFMSNNYDEGGRHYDNHGLSINYNPQSFSQHHWHRRGYPVHPTPHSGSYPMRLFHSRLQDDDFSTMYVPPIRRYPNRGASQETIENNTLSYKFLPINENFDSEKCSICLSPFEVDTFVRRLPCLHFYHRECIEQWLQLNSTCPICRIDIQKARNI